jgi:hypothetical protein
MLAVKVKRLSGFRADLIPDTAKHATRRVLWNARSKMSMSPSSVPARPLCRGRPLSSSENLIDRYEKPRARSHSEVCHQRVMMFSQTGISLAAWDTSWVYRITRFEGSVSMRPPQSCLYRRMYDLETVGRRRECSGGFGDRQIFQTGRRGLKRQPTVPSGPLGHVFQKAGD